MKTMFLAAALTVAIPAIAAAAGQSEQKGSCCEQMDCCEDGGKDCCDRHAGRKGDAGAHAGHDMSKH